MFSEKSIHEEERLDYYTAHQMSSLQTIIADFPEHNRECHHP